MLSILFCLVFFVVIAIKTWSSCVSNDTVSSVFVRQGKRSKLVVLVHGMGGPARMRSLGNELVREEPGSTCEEFDILSVEYPMDYLHIGSNADPNKIANKICEEIGRRCEEEDYDSITLVGHSMGGLLIRKAFLIGIGKSIFTSDPPAVNPAPEIHSWARKVERIVLLAGLNRGLNLTERAPDMSHLKYAQFLFSSWLADALDFGRLLRDMESGSPFVANLRMEWVKYVRDSKSFKVKGKEGGSDIPHAKPVEVVQLLGDIDDLVSEEDSNDLEAGGDEYFAWLLMRGSGHNDILQIEDSEFGQYRKNKIFRALTNKFSCLKLESERLPQAVDPAVRQVVFVVHGIRDLGRWSANFEDEIRAKKSSEKIVLLSPRYNYLGMGPFLLPSVRQHHVRWLMDEITEAHAKYPNAERFDYIGHSNGTYLLADALRNYRSLKMERLVFAGSVVPQNYDWQTIVDRDQIKEVRNYKTSDDWVVALFPRLFEYPGMSLLGNDLGSAGFNGFTSPPENVKNIGPLEGGHSAFLSDRKCIDDAVAFVLEKSENKVASWTNNQVAAPLSSSERCLKFVSDWLCYIVWAVIFVAVVFVGYFVMVSAKQFYIPAAAVYFAAVVWVLHRL